METTQFRFIYLNKTNLKFRHGLLKIKYDQFDLFNSLIISLYYQNYERRRLLTNDN